MAQSLRICCQCHRELAEGENYYKIDGVRFWCIECGRIWLKEQHPHYEDKRARVAVALSQVDTDKITVKARRRR